jgi:hypothetical protein
MANSPNGYLLMREYPTLVEAHLAASFLASTEVSNPDFRLIEVSPSAGGTWVCAFNTKTAEGFDAVKIDEKVLNAFLSLGPKPESETTSIGIVESSSIANVFLSCMQYCDHGLKLLEIRVKRAGPVGAHAFFALKKSEVAEISALPVAVPMTVVPLSGDYRRFF